jgi:hypothetical protein
LTVKKEDVNDIGKIVRFRLKEKLISLKDIDTVLNIDLLLVFI